MSRNLRNVCAGLLLLGTSGLLVLPSSELAVGFDPLLVASIGIILAFATLFSSPLLRIRPS